jgi:2-keto-4-pentenoate hydratase
VVICGSVVPALDVAAGDTVEVQLDPLGSLQVKFL